MQFFCFIRFGNVKVQKKKKRLKKRFPPFSDKTNSNVMLIKNDCLHLINNHPKSQKTFTLSVTSLSAGEMSAVHDKRETFPDRTNNNCYLTATINAEF